MALTKRTIDAAKYAGDGKSQQILYDPELPNFGVRIYPSGVKSFVVRYRTRTGRTRIVTLGKHGVLTVDEARKRARKMLVEVGDGGDPAEDRRRKKALTLRAFSPIYLERHARPRKKTWREDERRLTNDILPALGSRTLADIRRADVAALHSKVGKRAPVEANRVLALASRILALAEEWGYLPEGQPNAARGIKPFREESRDRFVSELEMPRLVKAIGEEPNPFIRGVLWLYLLTGARKSELLNAKWTDIDTERRELRLDETKSGRVHYLPLSKPALDILDALPRFAENPFIFPGQQPGAPLKHIAKNWRAIRERAGLEDVHLHDLRRTVGSWLAMGGASLVLIGRVLNHSDPGTTQIYARLADQAAAQALEDHGAHVLRVVQGGKA